jgi:transcription initiation factor TFIID subunit 7
MFSFEGNGNISALVVLVATVSNFHIIISLAFPTTSTSKSIQLHAAPLLDPNVNKNVRIAHIALTVLARTYAFIKMSFKLKLNVNTAVPSTTSLATPALATPLATPGGRPKLKITNKSVPPTPATGDELVKGKKTKAGRAPKPSAKVVESRKRVKEESDTEGEGSTIQVAAPAATQVSAPPSKKIKLSIGGPKTPATPVVLKAKLKGKPPVRPLGEGYDSEASDREEDPAIEEEFVLRMAPGDDCDYLREMINKKLIGTAKSQGGPDIHMKFFLDGRRAAIMIRKNVYAATLVDLPTVIEGMKSWDKRNWLKSADICQMLWVFAPIKKEEEAKTIPLPAAVDEKTHQFPHGLTPPMQYARRNRFRHRLHKTQIEEVEDEVNRLLAADLDASETYATFIDPDVEDRRASQALSPGSSGGDYDMGEQLYSEDEDAEGEADETEYFTGNHHGNNLEETQEEEPEGDIFDLDAALADHVELDTPMSTAEATPSQANGAAGTPIEDSGDESPENDGDDDDEDEEEEIDEEEKARLAQIEGTREDIADLEKQIANVQAQWTAQSNQLLRRRLEDNLRKLKQELQLKKSSIGEGEENE